MKPRTVEPIILLILIVALLVWSGVSPNDRLTWWLEVTPVLIAIPLLLATASRFPLTPLAYRLVFLHAIVLIVGGHYTYEKVPLGDWVRDALHLARNHYDRLGHFTPGFVPAILAREVLIRRSPLRRGGWLLTLTTATCLAVSAAFELVEWAAAVTLGQSADAYLATQGDVWDTQWDMFCALAGALASQALLGGMHDRQLEWARDNDPDLSVRTAAAQAIDRIIDPPARSVAGRGGRE
jgi:putative membrane protein